MKRAGVGLIFAEKECLPNKFIFLILEVGFMLIVRRIILATIVLALSVYAMVTDNYELSLYMLFFLELMMPYLRMNNNFSCIIHCNINKR